jgi:hypothetical protein
VNPKPSPLAFVIFLLAGWISRQQLIVIKYLKAENRMLRERLKGRALRFSDRERALLARKAFGIRRKVLLGLGTRMILVGRAPCVVVSPSPSLTIIASATTKDCAIDLFSQSQGLWRRVHQFVGVSDSVGC